MERENKKDTPADAQLEHGGLFLLENGDFFLIESGDRAALEEKSGGQP
jgi:hypothetical protein